MFFCLEFFLERPKRNPELKYSLSTLNFSLPGDLLSDVVQLDLADSSVCIFRLRFLPNESRKMSMIYGSMLIGGRLQWNFHV